MLAANISKIGHQKWNDILFCLSKNEENLIIFLIKNICSVWSGKNERCTRNLVEIDIIYAMLLVDKKLDPLLCNNYIIR